MIYLLKFLSVIFEPNIINFIFSALLREFFYLYRFSFLKGSKFSLFLVKKRCLKVFSKETKQDFYSSKKLLDNCFPKISSLDIYNFEKDIYSSPYFGHFIFWRSNFSENRQLVFTKKSYLNSVYCIHCGLNLDI